jgi:hypothetical protein
MKLIGRLVLLLIPFLFVGCDSTKYQIPNEQITEYLSKQWLSQAHPDMTPGNKWFCSYENVSDEEEDNEILMYGWIVCDELNAKLEQGSGLSGPIKFTLKKKGKEIQIVSHYAPEDESLRRFPLTVRPLLDFDQERVERLTKKNKEQAKQFFEKQPSAK